MIIMLLLDNGCFAECSEIESNIFCYCTVCKHVEANISQINVLVSYLRNRLGSDYLMKRPFCPNPSRKLIASVFIVFNRV